MTAAALYVAASVLIALAAFVLAVHLTRSILT
jgi:CrcB protein